MMESSVVLPLPDGPISMTISPRQNLQIHTSQGADLVVPSA